MGGLRERNLVCDHGSEVLARCPAWHAAKLLWKSVGKMEEEKSTRAARDAIESHMTWL